jgi:hypothetical protein
MCVGLLQSICLSTAECVSKNCRMCVRTMHNICRNIVEFSSEHYRILFEVLSTCYVLLIYRYSKFLRCRKPEITDTWE